MFEQPQTLLITGGAGFIGSSLVRHVLALPEWRVANLDKLTYAGHRASLADVLDDPRHQLIVGDIADASLLSSLLKDVKPSAVIHLAAESHVDRSIDRPPDFASTNVVGTCVLLDAVTQYWQTLDQEGRQSFCFLNVSTDEVFGSAAANQVFDEESPFAPNSPYAASKAAGDHFVRAFHNTYGLPTVTVHPSNNFGPRQHPEKLIPKMTLSAAERKPLPVYGDGMHQRDWLHVDDCCRALLAILQHGKCGKRFLIGGGNSIINQQLVEMICDLVDELIGDAGNRRRLITHVSDRPGHDRCYRLDSTRLERATDWKPQIAFQTGLQQTVQWYLENSTWLQEIGYTKANT